MTALAYSLKGWTDRTLADTEEKVLAGVSAFEATTPQIITEPRWHEWLRELVYAPLAPKHTVSGSARPMVPELQEQLDILLELEDVAVPTETRADSGGPMIVDTPVLETGEMLWLQEHPEIWAKFAGNWVAVGRGKVLAWGVEPREVLAVAKRSGVEKPLLFKVPSVQRAHFYAND